MTMKERIEAMKLPGNNGPARRQVFKADPKRIDELAKKLEELL
jgi:hypothetical protein